MLQLLTMTKPAQHAPGIVTPTSKTTPALTTAGERLCKGPHARGVIFDAHREESSDSLPTKCGRPTTWIAEGTGSGDFNGRAFFTERSLLAADAAKRVPLASDGSIMRAKTSGELSALSRQHGIRPGPRLSFAPNCRTNIPSHSARRIIIHSADQFDPQTLANEIARVGAPGALVTLTGVFPHSGHAALDAVLTPMMDALAPLRSSGERLMEAEFRSFPLHLIDRKHLLTGKVTAPQFATAKWTFDEFLAFVRTFPRVQRAERWSSLRKDDGLMPSGLLRRIDLGGSFGRMKEAWGSPRKARSLRWPMLICTGLLPPRQGATSSSSID